MTPTFLLGAVATFKNELKVVFGVLALILALPVLGVMVLVDTGIPGVSSALASADPTTQTVEVHDPLGKVVAQISASTVWPVGGVVTLEFGQPDPPFQPFHTGIDIASPNHQVGDPVVAFMAGKVIYSGYDNFGFGNHVIIDHGNNITSIYGHLDSLGVPKGQEVQAGTIIGTRGTTGWSTGPHLHFQINVYGIPVNPRTFVSGDPPGSR